MSDIFLSYAREDEARARTLAAALESRGWAVFWDRQIPHGRNFRAHIQEQLDAARCQVTGGEAEIVDPDAGGTGRGGSVIGADLKQFQRSKYKVKFRSTKFEVKSKFKVSGERWRDFSTYFALCLYFELSTSTLTFDL